MNAKSYYFENATTGAAVKWKVTGWRESVHVDADGHGRAGSTCDKCSASIRYVVTLRATDGRVLEVGQDCAVTLQGGPELAEIRAAEAAWLREQYLKSPEYARRRAEERAREAAKAERAARAQIEHGYELAGLQLIVESANSSDYERDIATRRRDRLVAGDPVESFETLAECDKPTLWTLIIAVAKAFMPPADHYVGAVKERVERVAFFEAMIRIDSEAFGTRWIHKFRCADGAILCWFTAAGDLRRDDIGSWVRIKGTVK